MAINIDTSAFTEEAYELLGELEESLLALEESPTDDEIIGRVFRAMHTIKGSGAMFGFDEVSKFTHEVETVFDLARNKTIPVTKVLIDLTLAARDHIRSMLDSADSGEVVDQIKALEIIEGLRKLASNQDDSEYDEVANQEDETAQQLSEEASEPQLFRIRFKPHLEIFSNGTNPLLLLGELKELGEARIIANYDDLPELENLDPEQCHTSWEIFLTTSEGENAIRDVFIFVDDDCHISIRNLEDQNDIDSEPQKLGDILVKSGDISTNVLEKAIKPLGHRLVDSGDVTPSIINAALEEQNAVREKREQKKKSEPTSSIRVTAEKLDNLVDLVGELVTVQARLNQISSSRENSDLQLITEEIERLTGELRDNTMSIRMLAIGSTFNKFKRLVRDLSKDLGKQVEMSTEGAETELDKNVIDQLNDSLVHIIRNSIDHGIESPEERLAKGKPAEGTIHLAAIHSGASVLIRVDDDGAGLDPDLLRQKAIAKGFIASDSELSDKEAYQLILGAGFSMAKSVTNVSGRGVGMDVVRRSIENLRGSIDISSTLGKGTSFTLKLPLTLAIIEGLLIKVGEEVYVIPLANVEECVELSAASINSSHSNDVINVRDEIVPYIRLRDRFDVEGERPAIEQIIISNVNENRVGFVVDDVIGQHQTVIKSLGKNFDHSSEFSGATILGDGSVALILDLREMVRYVEYAEIRGTL
ncbi:MAG: chemotaxis protein CheA [Magnetococcales bacterium]|nr:chemotaxis protein CheA [Magnetococcales bacterium]